MKFTPEVIAALAVLREHADNDFERHRIDVLERDLTAPPQVEVIDDTHQRFNGMIYHKNPSGHYMTNLPLHRAVWSFNHGQIPNGYHIHHIDQDKANNHIENLQALTNNEHRRTHNNLTKQIFPRICPVCGETFAPKHRAQVCCSWGCAGKLKAKPPVKKICPVCGKNFTVSYPNRDQIYCSYSCALAHRTNSHIEKICPTCGKKFTVTYGQRDKIYCSRDCVTTYLTKPRIEKTCPVCGKNFSVRPSREKQICCSRSCRSTLINANRKK